MGDIFLLNAYTPYDDLAYVKAKNPSIKIFAFNTSFCGIMEEYDPGTGLGFDYSRCSIPSAYKKRFYDCEAHNQFFFDAWGCTSAFGAFAAAAAGLAGCVC